MTAAEVLSGPAPGLLSRLSAAGVTVTLKEGGAGFKLRADAPPPPELLAEVREHRPALLEFLREVSGAAAPETAERGREEPSGGSLAAPEAGPAPRPEAPAPAFPEQEAADRLADLPPELHSLISAAEAGTLPAGAQKLRSGLCTDLGTYVLGWAESWPRDRKHTLRRLWEAAEAY